MTGALLGFAPSAATMITLAGCTAKATLLLAAAWAGAWMLRRGTAAARHRAWTLGVLAALAVPPLAWALPAIPLSWPSSPAGPGGALFAAAVTLTGRASPLGVPAWPLGLALAWGSGTAWVLVHLLRSHLAAHRVLRDATPTVNPAWLSAEVEAAALLGVSGRVPLLRSDSLPSPVTIGVYAPQVVLPAAADGWAPERLRAVLLHELGHVQRHDTRVQLAAQLTCALYWWSPLAWLAAARLRAEREHACDDLVLRAGVRPTTYAEALLDVARAFTGERPRTGGAACMADPAGVEARLRRILQPGTPRAPLGAGLRLAAPIGTGAVALALSCTTTPAVTAPHVSGEPPTAVHAAAPTPSGPHSWFGSPTILTEIDHTVPAFLALDTLDTAIVEAEVNRHMGDLQACYERRLVERPTLAGHIEIHWGISAAGEVVEQCLGEDTVQDPELADCVNALVSGSHYPASSAPFNVSYPFEFEPGPAPGPGPVPPPTQPT